MNNIMIDIETLGTGNDSVILSIGAVQFDLFTGETKAEFYRVINIQSCLDKGLKVSGDTIAWWIEQAEGKDNLKGMFYGTQSLDQVLSDLTVWILSIKELDKPLSLWGNSARFDLGIIETAYKACGFHIPWNIYDEKCYRTVTSLVDRKLLSDPVTTPFEGTKHNPLDDCKHQIKKLKRAFSLLHTLYLTK